MKKNKGFGLVGVLILVVAVLAVGGVAYYTGKNANKAPENKGCLPATAPWIKVVSPNGGETYVAGQQITVEWTSCNVLAPIYLSLKRQDPNQVLENNNDNGLIYPWVLGTDGTANDGSEQVTLPLASDSNILLGQHYYVTATSSGNYSVNPPTWETDNSDSLFTIQ